MVLAYFPLLNVNYYVLFANSDIMKPYVIGEGSKEMLTTWYMQQFTHFFSSLEYRIQQSISDDCKGSGCISITSISPCDL